MQKVTEAAKCCATCGALMLRKRFGGRLEDLSAFNKRKFCSLSCANTREALTKHGYSWRARKHLKTCCEACGSEQKLEAHHIDQDKANNDPSNIQTLCSPCHDFWHATAKRIGWPIAGRMPSLVPQWAFPSGWTALKPSEIALFRKSSKQSGAQFSKRSGDRSYGQR